MSMAPPPQDQSLPLLDAPSSDVGVDHPDETSPTSHFRSNELVRRLGRFDLLLELAKGGMATLYLARIRGPEGFQKLVALKRIHEQYSDQDAFIRMFLDEARLAAQIQHPNVAAVFDMGMAQGAYFLTMEYVHGVSLNQVLRAATRTGTVLRWHHTARMVAEAAAGLHAAHELRNLDGKPLNVVHRDVSPQNILVSFSGDVKVVDFGIAYAAERLTTTTSGTMKGKASYMSPEQVMGKPIDRRSDIFSLGIVLWEAVMLRRLFREQNSAAALLRIRDGDVPRPRSLHPDLPVPVERVILKALAHRPEDRYQTMAELERALCNVLEDLAGHSHRDQTSEVMEILFHDRRRIMDQQIRAACMASDDDRDVPSQIPLGPETSTATELSLGERVGHTQARSSSTRRLPLFIGAALGVVVAGILIGFWFRDHRAPARITPSGVPMGTHGSAHPQPSEPFQRATRALRRPVRMPRTTQVLPPLVQLDIVVYPSTSSPTVWVNGARYNAARVHLTLPKQDSTLQVEVTAAGYHRYRGELNLSRDGTHVVRLRTLRRPVARGWRRRGSVNRRVRPTRPAPPKKRDYADLVKPL